MNMNYDHLVSGFEQDFWVSHDPLSVPDHRFE
jgi:hypothetical protein